MSWISWFENIDDDDDKINNNNNNSNHTIEIDLISIMKLLWNYYWNWKDHVFIVDWNNGCCKLSIAITGIN